jgi:stalled ribosome rescue protein Dom34
MSTQHAIVWIDHSQAHVILFDSEHVLTERIKSRHTHAKPNGGDEAFFHSVAQALNGVQEILVTGPAKAKDEFRAHCQHHDKAVSQAIVAVIASDHPTDPQLLAMAKQYFLRHDKMQGSAPLR